MRGVLAVALSFLVTGVVAGDERETVWAPTIVAVKGSVRIRRVGWKQWAPAYFGVAVHPKDLLNTDAGASVQVLCADLSRGTLTEGRTEGVPCKTNRPPIKNDAGQYQTSLRGDESTDRSLILITPRWTRIVDPHPTIRWSAPSDVKRFEVTVRGSGVLWTRTVDGQTSLRYPDDAPRLAPGNQYAISITAGELSSIRTGEPWPFFEVASRAQLDTMERQLRMVQSLGLGQEKNRVLEAKLLANLGMNAAAIERLEQVSPNFGAAIADRLLAGIYHDTGLDHLAVIRYRTALRKAVASGDAEGQALAADALGSLCQRFGLCARGEARTSLGKALEIYQKLGAEKHVKRLREELATFQ